MQLFQIGNFEYTQDDKGSWIYKSKDPDVKLGSQKATYQEKPEYSLQEEIEGSSKDRFKSVINKTVLETVSYIKNNLK